MRNISNIQRKKQAGFVLTSELVLIVTILVIGMTVGLVSMRDAMTAEMHDVAEAIGNLDQSYAFNGIENAQGTAATNGSAVVDAVDLLAGDSISYNYVEADIVEGIMVGPAGPSAASAGPASGGDVDSGTNL